MSELTHYRICPLCEACCGLEVQVRDGRVSTIRGAEYDVLSAGYVCPKGLALKDLHEDPDRLRTPLIKRDGRFVQASWAQAWDEIGRRLPLVRATHGSDAVGLVAGNPAAHKIGLMLYLPRLQKAMGSRNQYSATTLDQMPRHLVSGLLYGHWMSVPVPDISHCDWLLLLGTNPLASNGSMWTVPNFRGKLRAMQARGGRLVVIDPRRTETANVADEHVFIRPGADAFLLLGMLHTLFDEGLVRLGTYAALLEGVSEIEASVRAFSAEAVAARCGVEASTVRALARTLATTERAAVHGRIGTCTQEYGSLSTWLLDVLNALTGHLDLVGGSLFPKAAAFAANTLGRSGSGRGVVLGQHASRVSGFPERMGELPITCLAEEMETAGENQLRALITVASNPVLSTPNGERIARALDRLDFMVSMDIYLNETTRHADVILPGPSPLEDLHYDVPFPQLSWRNHARFSAPVFEPVPGQPSEWETLLRLTAVISGQGTGIDPAAWDAAQFAQEVTRRHGDRAQAILDATAGLSGPLRWLDLALRTGPYGDQFGQRPGGLTLAQVQAAPGGVDLGSLEPRLPDLLRTPSGKVELAPPLLLGDLQRAADDLKRAPPSMVIIGRRDVRSNNSWMHNLPLLAKGPERCTALVHPQDAARLGLSDGGAVRISRGGHSVEAPVEISHTVMPGVVSLPHGWGHGLPGTQQAVAAERPGANLNALLDDVRRDPLSGTAVLSGLTVVLTPA